MKILLVIFVLIPLCLVSQKADPYGFENARLMHRLYEVNEIPEYFKDTKIEKHEKNVNIVYKHNDYNNIIFIMNNGKKSVNGNYLKTYTVIIESENPKKLIKDLELDIITARTDLFSNPKEDKYKLLEVSEYGVRIYTNNLYRVLLAYNSDNENQVILSIAGNFH